jgi:hypothetical protein
MPEIVSVSELPPPAHSLAFEYTELDMKRWRMYFVIASALTGVAAMLATGVVSGQSAGSVDLLPDQTLKGWTRIPWTATQGLQPKIQWRVDPAQHTLICTGDAGHEWLRYDKELGDFVFEVDWRFTPLGKDETRYNSGVGARLSQFGELWFQAQTGVNGGYLFGNNIVDGVIGRVNLSKEMKENRVKPAGEWNHYELRAQGSRLTLAVNGAVVNEVPNCGLRRGYIALEAEGFEITFRNLKLQELK